MYDTRVNVAKDDIVPLSTRPAIFFGIFIDPIPILLIFFLNWGSLFVGFKGYLIKFVTSVWETDVDSLTLGKCAKVWKESRTYTIGFCFFDLLTYYRNA